MGRLFLRRLENKQAMVQILWRRCLILNKEEPCKCEKMALLSRQEATKLKRLSLKRVLYLSTFKSKCIWKKTHHLFGIQSRNLYLQKEGLLQRRGSVEWCRMAAFEAFVNFISNVCEETLGLLAWNSASWPCANMCSRKNEQWKKP